MNLYLVELDKYLGFEAYNSMVVAAKSPKDARKIHPDGDVTHTKNGKWMYTNKDGSERKCFVGDWVSLDQTDELTVKYLGKTKEPRGVILSSINVG